MNPELGPELSRLTDRDLLEAVHRLARSERDVTARLMAHLVEMEARRLYLSQGCRSFSIYCIEILRFSEYEAILREQVTRECLRFPMILDLLKSGDLHLTNVRLLILHLTPENHRELLEGARGKTKRELELLLASRFPKPDPLEADLFRDAEDAFDRKASGGKDKTRSNSKSASKPGTEKAQGTPRAKIIPVAADRFRITFTANAEMLETLNRLKNLLSHQIPDGNEVKIFDRALSALLREVEKQKLATTNKPLAARPATRGSRHIPAAVKRAVWARDGGRCAFVGENGHRCSARRFLQWHHLHPHGDGGPATVENIEMRCRGHNRYESDQYYGPHFADCEPAPDDLSPSSFSAHESESREAG